MKFLRICLLTLFALCTQFAPIMAQRLWGNIDHAGKPWVSNISAPYHPSEGLQGRHIALWASHGRYYDNTKGLWKWQRPNLFGTTEDLFTPTLVYPYLVPMLEKAGAIVFSPRERSLQTHEYIIDNDTESGTALYREIPGKYMWVTSPQKGFAKHQGNYSDNENPFEAGSARMVLTSRKERQAGSIVYQPNFEEEGYYPVYVSYQTVEGSIDDALYTVCHKGERTQFKVNQQMGGNTWVYLGTFLFDKGCNEFNRVEISSQSKTDGIVTSDAVRFGGGMGNILRGGAVSGLPRALEGARYYAQWAGAPYSVYSSKNGQDDYGDDINTRSLMTNWLGGGSVYMPSIVGKRVPIELSLAIHSDAGYARNYQDIIGSLAICTTDFNDGRLNAGISRMASKLLATTILKNLQKDLASPWKPWTIREIWDRNYSETRIPEVPAVIVETMSHQNFPDMKRGQDPYFQFMLARSIYKSILQFIAGQHGKRYAVAPLAPTHFSVTLKGKNRAHLEWTATKDDEEPTATPSRFIVYRAQGNGGFDNGTVVKGNSFTQKIEPGVLYHYKVAAVNNGGESFPTQVLSVRSMPDSPLRLLIVDGFKRLAAPKIIDTDIQQGFDLEQDPGVPYGHAYAGWSGKQIGFEKNKIGVLTTEGLGYSGDELMGTVIAGNTFNYTQEHALAIAQSNLHFNIESTSINALTTNKLDIKNFDVTDLYWGLEKHDGYSEQPGKIFPPTLQPVLEKYLTQGGKLLISGSFTASDMQRGTDKSFLQNVLKTDYAGTFIPNDSLDFPGNNKAEVHGLGTVFTFWNKPNKIHYAASHPDILEVKAGSAPLLQYSDGSTAAIGYRGMGAIAVLGFPFECVTTPEQRELLMDTLLKFLTNKSYTK